MLALALSLVLAAPVPVADGIWRSAALDASGIPAAKELGIRTIVDLRADDEDTMREAEAARAAGIDYVNLPMSGFSRPDPERVEAVLALLDDPARRPILVHCRHGEDRTGVVVACLRIVDEGWDVERAYDEALTHGMAWWQLRMKRFVRQGCPGVREPRPPE